MQNGLEGGPGVSSGCWWVVRIAVGGFEDGETERRRDGETERRKDRDRDLSEMKSAKTHMIVKCADDRPCSMVIDKIRDDTGAVAVAAGSASLRLDWCPNVVQVLKMILCVHSRCLHRRGRF